MSVITCGLGVLTVERSAIWRSTLYVFGDAAQKEPLAAYAQYGLGLAQMEEWARRIKSPDPRIRQEGEAYRAAAMLSWERFFVTVDCNRQISRLRIALSLGDFFRMDQNYAKARYYYNEVLKTYPGIKQDSDESYRKEARERLAQLPPEPMP